ncbi:hypothetical protein SAMN06265360_12040 [Haloechinothrix alba]|uniref:Uncharacterized protein n=1 Tax=Haloechinothrix alba TaxID=664784 RepID=A0A238ZB76_9PSEU|nr:hypothetical protein SAMN06265360_12040 [Haloechinothrix alba]
MTVTLPYSRGRWLFGMAESLLGTFRRISTFWRATYGV